MIHHFYIFIYVDVSPAPTPPRRLRHELVHPGGGGRLGHGVLGALPQGQGEHLAADRRMG